MAGPTQPLPSHKLHGRPLRSGRSPVPRQPVQWPFPLHGRHGFVAASCSRSMVMSSAATFDVEGPRSRSTDRDDAKSWSPRRETSTTATTTPTSLPRHSLLQAQPLRPATPATHNAIAATRYRRPRRARSPSTLNPRQNSRSHPPFPHRSPPPRHASHRSPRPAAPLPPLPAPLSTPQSSLLSFLISTAPHPTRPSTNYILCRALTPIEPLYGVWAGSGPGTGRNRRIIEDQVWTQDPQPCPYRITARASLRFAMATVRLAGGSGTARAVAEPRGCAATAAHAAMCRGGNRRLRAISRGGAARCDVSTRPVEHGPATSSAGAAQVQFGAQGILDGSRQRCIETLNSAAQPHAEDTGEPASRRLVSARV
jgi:hypothetical protein